MLPPALDEMRDESLRELHDQLCSRIREYADNLSRRMVTNRRLGALSAIELTLHSIYEDQMAVAAYLSTQNPPVEL
jgi:hypothetical protein